MKQEKRRSILEKASLLLQAAGMVFTDREKEEMEVADCGYGDIERLGLQAVVYENNKRYCAKELILLPRQMFPEHRHPPLDEGNPGKQETFRCRWGEVYLYVEGNPTLFPKASVPDEYKKYLTVWKEIVLQPGDQQTLRPNTKHWFQAGDSGAVISEFSSTSLDEKDLFTDPNVRRIPEIR